MLFNKESRYYYSGCTLDVCAQFFFLHCCLLKNMWWRGGGGATEQSSQQTTRDDVLVNKHLWYGHYLFPYVSQHEIIENRIGLKIFLEMFQGAKVRSFRLAFLIYSLLPMYCTLFLYWVSLSVYIPLLLIDIIKFLTRKYLPGFPIYTGTLPHKMKKDVFTVTKKQG